MNEMEKKVQSIGVVPVIKLNHPERDAIPLAKALIAGGVPVAEVTFRAAGAAIAIKAMRENFPEMLVGAGTVLTIAQVDEAMAAGAQFIVTPGMDPEIVAYCQKVGIQIFPGCTTPTDYHTAYKFGLEVLKFFPAEQSGGINLKNLADYVKNPVIAACGGSYMVTADLIDNGKWDEITALCKQSVEIVKEARNG